MGRLSTPAMNFPPNLVRLVVALALVSIAAAAPARPPNIVYILADDLGWTDVGCQGSKYYETPNIDRLAAQGVRMLRYYNSQNCAPTRAVLLSGQYAPRTGIYTVGTLERGEAVDRRMAVPPNETRLPADKFTLAQALKAAGYTTGMFGKWHLGNEGEFHPSRRGFDEALVSDGRHFNFVTVPPVEHPKEQYLADFLTDRAVDFIGRHRDQPFFLYVPHFAVHTPIHAKEDYIAKWEKKPPQGNHWHPTYAAMIQSVDESVGRIMARLEELKLADNTVLIFSSDNGGLGGYDRTEPPSQKKGFTHNAPLRGGKGTLYEGGLRVPFIVRWPGVTRAGTTSEAPAAHVDIYPTFLEIAGTKPKSGYVLDGRSFVAALKNPAAPSSRDPIYWHFPGYLESYVHANGWRTTPAGAIHSGDFKLLEFFESGRLELYNVRDDVGETRDLAGARPDKVKELHGKLVAWRKEVGAVMPTMKTPDQLAAERSAPKKAQKKAGKGKEGDDEK
jgi:arylsulfatase A-like enzyme